MLKKKFKMALFNPLLIAILCVMGVLQLMQVDYKTYNAGGQYISYLLTPATVCLAVPLYRQLTLLRKNLKAVIIGIVSGVLASMVSVLVFAKLFGLSHSQYVTLLPKSITTAIGMGVSEELGGLVTITVAVIIITWKCDRRGSLQDCKNRGAYRERACAWYIRSRYRYCQGYGNGTGRRCHEQPCNCGCRSSDGYHSVCFCRIYVKTGF